MWQNWVNFALGIWLVIAAFIPGITASKSGSLWNDLIVGVLVAIFAFMATRNGNGMLLKLAAVLAIVGLYMAKHVWLIIPQLLSLS